MLRTDEDNILTSVQIIVVSYITPELFKNCDSTIRYTNRCSTLGNKRIRNADDPPLVTNRLYGKINSDIRKNVHCIGRSLVKNTARPLNWYWSAYLPASFSAAAAYDRYCSHNQLPHDCRTFRWYNIETSGRQRLEQYCTHALIYLDAFKLNMLQSQYWVQKNF